MSLEATLTFELCLTRRVHSLPTFFYPCISPITLAKNKWSPVQIAVMGKMRKEEERKNAREWGEIKRTKHTRKERSGSPRLETTVALLWLPARSLPCGRNCAAWSILFSRLILLNLQITHELGTASSPSVYKWNRTRKPQSLSSGSHHRRWQRAALACAAGVSNPVLPPCDARTDELSQEAGLDATWWTY